MRWYIDGLSPIGSGCRNLAALALQIFTEGCTHTRNYERRQRQVRVVEQTACWCQGASTRLSAPWSSRASGMANGSHQARGINKGELSAPFMYPYKSKGLAIKGKGITDPRYILYGAKMLYCT